MTIYKLGYYICHSKNDGQMRIKRRPLGEAVTRLDCLMNCFVYRCDSFEEFKRLMQDDQCGRRKGIYGGVLVEGSDGSRRWPTDTDCISPAGGEQISPALVVSSPCGEGLVPLGGPGAGDFPLCHECGQPTCADNIFATTHDSHANHYHAQCWADFVMKIRGPIGLIELVSTAPSSQIPADNATADDRSLLARIKLLLGESIRASAVAAQLGVSVDEVKAAVNAEGSGITLKAAGWLALTTN